MALLSRSISNNHVDYSSISNPLSSSIYRSESFSYGYGYMNMEQSYLMMEKRQVFLRSYQFCRKRSLSERIKRSLVRVKKVVWFRLRSARKLRRLVLSRLRLAFYRRRRYTRVMNMNNHYHRHHSSCLW